MVVGRRARKLHHCKHAETHSLVDQKSVHDGSVHRSNVRGSKNVDVTISQPSEDWWPQEKSSDFKENKHSIKMLQVIPFLSLINIITGK